MPAVEWPAIDEAISRLGKRRAQQDYEEGRWLLAGRRAAVHSRFGFATFAEYVERRLGYDPRTTADRLRVAEALVDLPGLRRALVEGSRHWSAVRELARVVVPQTEGEWLEATKGKSVRQVEAMVSGHNRGDRPADPKDPNLKKHIVRLELSPEVFARLRECLDRVRKEVDPHLSDEHALDDMCQRILGGPNDEGRSPYQVALTVCDVCERTWQQSRGEQIEVAAEVGERASCDGQFIGRAHVGGRSGSDVPRVRAKQSTPPAIRRTVIRRAGGCCEVPGFM